MLIRSSKYIFYSKLTFKVWRLVDQVEVLRSFRCSPRYGFSWNIYKERQTWVAYPKNLHHKQWIPVFILINLEFIHNLPYGPCSGLPIFCSILGQANVLSLRIMIAIAEKMDVDHLCHWITRYLVTQFWLESIALHIGLKTQNQESGLKIVWWRTILMRPWCPLSVLLFCAWLGAKRLLSWELYIWNGVNTGTRLSEAPMAPSDWCETLPQDHWEELGRVLLTGRMRTEDDPTKAAPRHLWRKSCTEIN